MNANRIERTVITVLCVLAAILVLLAMVHSTQPTRTVEASRAEYNDHAPAFGVLPPTMNTGECGYYREQGTTHRNMETPPQCVNTQGTTETSPQARPERNKHTVDGGGENPPVVTDKPNNPAPKPACKHGNPGNKKCKGNAGENPNGKGTMSQDSPDGNGEHGNQGTGGGEHGNKKGGNK